MKTILEIDYDLDSDDSDYAVTGTVYMNGIVEYVTWLNETYGD